MAYATSGFMMTSRLGPAVEDVILIQSDDDDPESDDVVLVSDTDSGSNRCRTNWSKKSIRKKSRHRRRGHAALNGPSRSVSKHGDSTGSGSLVFTSAFPGAHVSLRGKPAGMKKAPSSSRSSNMPFVNHRAYKDGCLQHFSKGKQFSNSSLKSSFVSKHSEFDLTSSGLTSDSEESQDFLERDVCENSAIGLELSNEPQLNETNSASVPEHQDLTSRDELASLTDADVSLLSNISFCSDLSNDLPSDLPSAFTGELSIDLGNEFAALDAQLAPELENSASIGCHLPLESLNGCLGVESFPQRILDDLNGHCQNSQLSTNCLNIETSATREPSTYTSNRYVSSEFYNCINSSCSELVHNACLHSSGDANHCATENSELRNLCSGENLCNLESSLRTVDVSNSSKVCDVGRVCGGSKMLFDIDNNSDSAGNLLAMELLKELESPLEISKLCSMGNIQAFPNLSQVVTESIEANEAAVCLEDKDLDIDLSSTFIKNVLNLNIGESIADTLCQPLNFSSIVSEFDSLISADSHLPVSFNSSFSFPQNPDLSSLSLLPSVQQYSLSLKSHNGFDSDICVNSSSVVQTAGQVFSPSAFSALSTVSHSDDIMSEISVNCMTKNSDLLQMPLENVDAMPESGAILVETGELCSSLAHLSADCVETPKTDAATLRDSSEYCFDTACNSVNIAPDKVDLLPEATSSAIQSLMPGVDLPVQLSSSGSNVIDSLPVLCCSEDVFCDDYSRTCNLPDTSKSLPVTACNLDSADISQILVESLPPSASLPSFNTVPFVSDGLPTAFRESMPLGSSSSWNDIQDAGICNNGIDSTSVNDQNSFSIENAEDLIRRDSHSDFDDGMKSKGDCCVEIPNGFRDTDVNLSNSDSTAIKNTGSDENPHHRATNTCLTLSIREQDGNSEDTVFDELSDMRTKDHQHCERESSETGFKKRHRSRSSSACRGAAVACKKPRVYYNGKEQHSETEPEFITNDNDLQNCEDQSLGDIQEPEFVDGFDKTVVNIDSCVVNSTALFQKPQTNAVGVAILAEVTNKGEEERLNDGDMSIDLDKTHADELIHDQILCISPENDDDDNDADDDLSIIGLDSVNDDSVQFENDHLNWKNRNFDLDCKIMNDTAHHNGILDISGKIQNCGDAVELGTNLDESTETDDHEKGFLEFDKDQENSYTATDSDVERSIYLDAESDETELDITQNVTTQNTETSSVLDEDIVSLNETPNESESDVNCDDDFTSDETVAKVTSKSPEVVDVVVMAKCFNCLKDIAKSILAYCTAGHGCCASCLHGQVKAFLATSSKSLFSCQFQGCNSFYLITLLRSSLPKMVVDILEEKLEREYNASTTQLLMKMNGVQELNTDTDEELDNEPIYGLRSAFSDPVVERDAFELPLGWKEMTGNEEFKLVDIIPDSEDFVNVSSVFHETMLKSRATILRLQRLQNPVLWEFYSVKKKQKEIEGMDKEFYEKLLFHGIRQEFLDTICLNNFDWRTCGVSHGIMYGQGTYFARDASYAHRYTDRNPYRVTTSSASHPADALPLGGLSIVAEPGLTESFPKGCSSLLNGSVSTEGHFPEPKSSSETETLSASGVGLSKWEQHVHLMFLARVFVGRYTQGKRTYRKPPPIDVFAPYGKCYDSCVNYMDDPSLFVIFDNSQFYPEYLVHYINKPRQNTDD